MPVVKAKTKSLEHYELVPDGDFSDPVIIPRNSDAIRVTLITLSGSTTSRVQFTTTPLDIFTKVAETDPAVTMEFLTATPDTITRGSGTWAGDGFEQNMTLEIYKPGAPNHRIGQESFTVASFTSTELTLGNGQAIVEETPGVAGYRIRGRLSPSSDVTWQDWTAGNITGAATTTETFLGAITAVRCFSDAGEGNDTEFEVVSEN